MTGTGPGAGTGAGTGTGTGTGTGAGAGDPVLRAAVLVASWYVFCPLGLLRVLATVTLTT